MPSNKAGVDLTIVALDNEIRHGMLWPIGKVDVDIEPYSALVANFSNLATLYNSARAGADDAVGVGVKKPEVLTHIDNGWNITLEQRWFGALTANGVEISEWDTSGFSFLFFLWHISYVCQSQELITHSGRTIPKTTSSCRD